MVACLSSDTTFSEVTIDAYVRLLVSSSVSLRVTALAVENVTRLTNSVPQDTACLTVRGFSTKL
jgi:hypothetical protein